MSAASLDIARHIGHRVTMAHLEASCELSLASAFSFSYLTLKERLKASRSVLHKKYGAANCENHRVLFWDVTHGHGLILQDHSAHFINALIAFITGFAGGD